MKSTEKNTFGSSIVRLLFKAIIIYLFLYEACLAFIGYPSTFDYQHFDLSFWVLFVIAIIPTAIFYFFNKVSKAEEGKTENLSTFKAIVIVVSLLISVIVVKNNEHEINEFKYHLPLAKIETIQISGRLSEDIQLWNNVYGSLDFQRSMVLEEYPKKYFQLEIRRKLRNEINSINNDTLFMKRGEVVSIKLRATDYERMMAGKTNSSFFRKDRFDGKKMKIYELVYNDEVIFKRCGIK